MKITMIGCPFQTTYGYYAELLKEAIEQKTGSPIEWLASNCGCGDPAEINKLFQIQCTRYFELPHIHNYAYTPERKAWEHWLRSRASHLSYTVRSRRYSKLSTGAELVHFQQILNAYGFSVVYHWLNRPSKAARVVTVHELDPYQLEFPEKCSVYNMADAVHVHCEEMKRDLVQRSVSAEKIHVVPQGTVVADHLEETPREGIVFYGGHHLMSGKGISTLFEAESILKQRLGADAPAVKIHGHYPERSLQEARPLAQKLGVADRVDWLPPLTMEKMAELYRSSRVCVLPYTGSFAGLPASMAAANGLPVVATRRAGIPDHLGDCGIWIEEGNAAQLAERVMDLLSDASLWQSTSERLRKHAKEFLRMDVIAESTLAMYKDALKNKAG
jgi:glycosyltransferase involved in cell wall biosynthesis